MHHMLRQTSDCHISMLIDEGEEYLLFVDLISFFKSISYPNWLLYLTLWGRSIGELTTQARPPLRAPLCAAEDALGSSRSVAKLTESYLDELHRFFTASILLSAACTDQVSHP